MRHLILFLLLPNLLAIQKKDFKVFFQDGKKALAAGNHQSAVANFAEAFRIESSAQSIREEGVHIVPYAPRYFLALAHEPLDLAKADEWAVKSKEAAEDKVIKDKKETQKYHADLARINGAAKNAREQALASYRSTLQEAESLLSQRKYDKAKSLFNELAKNHPDKPEGQAGVLKVENERRFFVKELELDFSNSLQGKKYSDAEGILAQIRQVDAGHINLARMEQQLASTRAEEEKARTTVASAAKPESSRPVVQPNQAPPRQSAPVAGPALPPPQVSAADSRGSGAGLKPPQNAKQALREALLDSLKPYRRGDPATALSKLEGIATPGRDESASYHWLRGLYLLTEWKQSAEPKAEQEELAYQSIRQALKLVPNFKPDQKLYPAFVLEAVEKVGKGAP